MLRYCISGSRGYTDAETILSAILTIPEGSVIVHGGAKGADSIADRLAREFGYEVEIWRPDWNMGKKAGPVRNRNMIETCDKLLAFWDGHSRGTASAIRAAIELDVDYEVFS